MTQPIKYYARDASNTCKQLLSAHLCNTAKLTQTFVDESGLCDTISKQAANLAGLLHDLGKYRQEFQDLLDGKRQRDTESAHAVYGAAAAGFRWNSLMLAFAIAGHHAGLYDLPQLALLLDGDKFHAKARFPALVEMAAQPDELGSFSNVTLPPFYAKNDRDCLHYEFLTRMLFSMLVDADRLDSERFEQECRLGRSWNRPTVRLQAAALLESLIIARREKASHHADDDLNRLRNTIFDACLRQGDAMSQGFFSLTVPTGGGKTLSSMAFALAHAIRHNLRRIIVVIPYLSIIEQNAREYRTIFGANHVLEHHSAVEISAPSKNGDDNEASQASWAELAMENWDAPIIVTTSVQFIESLFAASPRQARRLHNIARSVVVCDEVQTLPVHMLNPTLDVFRELKDRFGVSFVFCSATQPGFQQSASLKQGFTAGELAEIAPDLQTTYQKLRRVDFRIEPSDQKWTWVRVAEEMLKRPQSLCVLNLRRHAFAAWDALRVRLTRDGREADMQDAVFHLSSAMCPAHRLDLLGLSPNPPPRNIKARLKAKLPCWVVSTQLIEAGVDIDFPDVLRAMGPLDSIVQSAGRCNREGLLQDDAGRPLLGRVVVFHPEEGGLPLGLYSQATAIAPMYLDDVEKLAADPHIFAKYFTELYCLASTDHAKKGEHTIQENRAKLKFHTVAKDARVIKQDTITVIVPYRRAKKLVDKIRKTRRFDRQTLRRLQRYMVNLRRGPGSDLEQLTRIGAIEPLLFDVLDIPVLAEHCYDAQRGVIIKERSLEDLIL